MGEKIIAQLQQKVIDEQEASKQIEDELIKMKIEFDNAKDAKAKTPTKESMGDDETAKILRQKDHDIASLRRAIQQEQEIVAHVQLTQEKEIIEKEREIAVLNAILSQERQIILDRESEIGKLLVQNGGPKAASPTDDESTMTFHDALSDGEDVLIADLEVDDEEDDRCHRKSDIVDL